jgi:hypothetical protein
MNAIEVERPWQVCVRRAVIILQKWEKTAGRRVASRHLLVSLSGIGCFKRRKTRSVDDSRRAAWNDARPRHPRRAGGSFSPPWLWRPTAPPAIAPDRSSLSWPFCLVPLQILDRTTFVWALESALAGRVSEKIPRLARLGLFFSWSRVESGVFYGVALSALVSVLVR